LVVGAGGDAVTVKEAIERFLNEQTGILADSTIAWYSQRLGPLAAVHGLELDKVTGDELIELWKAQDGRDTRYIGAAQRPECDGGLSVYTLFGMVTTWRRFFNWCASKGYIEESPAAELRKPQLPDEPPKAISKRDMLKLLQEAKHTKYPKRDYALVSFLADTGCRVGGLIGLKLQDLDVETGRATVREKGRGGRRKARTVYMTPETIKALKAYLKDRTSTTDFVFVGRRGGLKISGVQQILERLAQRAGVTEHFNPHAFRHGFARGMLDNGADLATVSQWLGHEDIFITARFYARWADSEMKEKHDRYSWVTKSTQRRKVR
jgi:integrase/recombinase XerC